MKETNSNPEDMKLNALLRGARAAPSLPPRFQEKVWRRIEGAEAPDRSVAGPTWLDALALLLRRPRFAFAAVAVLIVAGASLGVHEGSHAARSEAQAYYVAVVAPNALR